MSSSEWREAVPRPPRPASAAEAARELAAALADLKEAAASCLQAPGATAEARAYISELLDLAVRLGAAGLASGSGGPQIAELTTPLTPTEVALVCTHLLQEVDLELFELAMWRNWGKA